MKYLFLLLIGTIGFVNVLLAQTFSKTYDLVEGLPEYFKAMQIVQDTVYALSPHICDTIECFTVLKIDPRGQVVKSRHFEWMDEGDDDTILENDSVIIIVGSRGLYENALVDFLVLSKDLDSLYHLEVQIPDSIVAIGVNSVARFLNSYVIVGSSFTSSGEREPAMLFRINMEDYSLDTIVAFHFGSRWTTFSQTFVRDSSLVVSYRRYDGSVWIWHGHVVLDNDNSVTWLWESEGDSFAHRDADAILLPNGNFVFEHSLDYEFPEFSLTSVTPNGEIDWIYDNDNDPFGRKELFKLSLASNGDILGCGQINWRWDPSDPTPTGDELYSGAYLFRMNSENGEILWERAIIDYDSFGYYAGEAFADIEELDDGSLIMGGSWKVYNSDHFLVDYRGWLVRTDFEGCVIAECGFPSFTTSTESVDYPFYEISVYPNPATNLLTVSCQEAILYQDIQYQISTSEGKMCINGLLKGDENHVDISILPQGSYFITFEDQFGRPMMVKRFVKF